jgi:hypothetical protein
VSKFKIEPHFRLQEWVAEEKGYFRAEGLDYEFNEFIRATDGAHHATTGKSGAFQSIEKGRESNVTCACHWTVNVAASRGHTRLFADAYSVAPSGIFVRNDATIRSPEDLAGVPISVGFQSGSHYATIQALEPYLAKDRINLSFGEGMLFHRMEAFFDGNAQAATLFGGPYYFAEQLGYRKIIDTTFMIGAMINGEPDMEDVRRYFQALRNAQRDIGTLIFGPNSIRTTTRWNSPNVSTQRCTQGAGGRGNGSFLKSTARRSLSSPLNGSRNTGSSKPEAWGRAFMINR